MKKVILFFLFFFFISNTPAWAQGVDPEAKVNLLVNGSHGPINVYYGDTATVSWTSTKVANCTVNWPLPENITQTIFGPSGTQTTVPIMERGTIYFTVLCGVPTGGSVDDSVIINMINRPPTPTAIPTIIPTAIPTVRPTTIPTIIPTSSPTAIPTIAPTTPPTPTTDPCPKKSQGDANCDNRIDLLDFNIWRDFFLNPHGGGPGYISPADFNSDNHVDLLDFNIWRTSFLTQ